MTESFRIRRTLEAATASAEKCLSISRQSYELLEIAGHRLNISQQLVVSSRQAIRRSQATLRR